MRWQGPNPKDNDQPEHFIVRKNLTDSLEPVWGAIDDTKQNVEAIEAELGSR